MPPNIQHCLRPCHQPSQQRLKLLCLWGIQSWLTGWSKIVPYTLEAEWVSCRILRMVTTTRLWVCVCIYIIYRVPTCLSHAIRASHACNSPWARATRVQPNLARAAVASFIGTKMLIKVIKSCNSSWIPPFWVKYNWLAPEIPTFSILFPSLLLAAPMSCAPLARNGG